MDSLKPKSRKIKKIAKKSRIFDLFSRSIEIIVVMITLAKLCYELVIMLEDSSVALAILANRKLAFFVGNAIVIALVAKTGLFSNQEVDYSSRSNDLYDEFVRESSRGKQSITENRVIVKQSIITENEAKQSIITEDEAKQSISGKTEKQSVTEKKKKTKKTKQSKPEKTTKQSIVEREDITTVKKKIEKQSYERSQSEKLEGSEKISCGKLRRSETDVSDSDDELRYKIESFIARQRRNQKDD